MLKIDGFPHAQYDSATRLGFLAYYYPSTSVRDGVLSEEDWRYSSYSPEILNYKEGRDEDIKRLVDPFLKLIRHAVAEVNATNTLLVPVPSSMAAHDPLFSTVPRKKGIKGSRNRDNRNSVFCSMLSIADGNLKVADNLIRTTTKPEKIFWTPEQHAKSLYLNTVTAMPAGNVALVTIDDVKTDGGTLQGVRLLLERAYPNAIVIGLAIGCTRAPNQFLPLASP
jgi:hypothetical protein